MHTDHISHESMRAYLLGLLSADEAFALEEEYFVNRAVFLKVQAEERALIADYLNGNLRSREKQTFEQRYLEVPARRSKVDAARREQAALRQNVQPKLSLTWGLSFAVALIVIVAIGIWIYETRVKSHQNSVTQNQPNSSPQIQPKPENSFATLYLLPGLTKGPGSPGQELQQPVAGSTVNLVLALPRRSISSDRTVQIFKVGADDSLTLVRSEKIRPSISRKLHLMGGNPLSNTELTLQLVVPSTLFQPGDYIVRARTADNKARQTYTYHVLPRENSEQK